LQATVVKLPWGKTDATNMRRYGWRMVVTANFRGKEDDEDGAIG